MIRPFAIVTVALFVASVRTPVAAMGGHWEPPNLHATAATLDAVLAANAKARGAPKADYAQRIERYSLVAGDVRLETTAHVRDADFRFHTEIAGQAYESGRGGGLRWRRTPNGLVRIIASDIQGDDLDRWPLSIFPFAAGDCTIAGESGGASPAWVIRYWPEHDVPHWFYVEERSGAIVREIFREGARVVSLDFDDFRTVDGVTRPYHWRIGGAGGSEEVSVEEVDVRPVPASDVTIPARGTGPFVPAITRPVVLPSTFDERRISLHASVNGRSTDLLLDTGTTQILLDGVAARGFGIRTVLGHGIAGDIAIGPVHLRDVAIETTDIGFDEGILGYEFFAGNIVHVDYRRQRVELLPRDGFEPPPDALRIDAWCGEGMPLVSAQLDRMPGNRFALDTGSPRVVVGRYFWEHDGGDANVVGGVGRSRSIRYLEGQVVVRAGQIQELTLGGVTVTQMPGDVELTGQGDTVEFPLDGIIGTDVLGGFEWWFDYSDDAIWFRLTA